MSQSPDIMGTDRPEAEEGLLSLAIGFGIGSEFIDEAKDPPDGSYIHLFFGGNFIVVIIVVGGRQNSFERRPPFWLIVNLILSPAAQSMTTIARLFLSVETKLSTRVHVANTICIIIIIVTKTKRETTDTTSCHIKKSRLAAELRRVVALKACNAITACFELDGGASGIEYQYNWLAF